MFYSLLPKSISIPRFFSLIFLLIFLLTLSLFPINVVFADINPDALKSECEQIMGIDQGTIIVLDLQKRIPIALINHEIAYSRSSRPGSVFKLVTAASLLEHGRIQLNETIDCKNRFVFMNKKYICSEIGGHGKVNLIKALSDSCSLFFYNFAQRLKPGELKVTAEKFGLGKTMPEDAPVDPVSGTCSPPKDPRQFIEFAVGDNKNISITPYQAANILCIISTGKPLKGCPAGKFSPKTLAILRKAMGESAKTGTCKRLSSLKMTSAGKTGTASNDRLPGKTCAWFIGFMPFEKPRYGVVVYLEDGKGFPDACPRALKVMQILKRSVQP